MTEMRAGVKTGVKTLRSERISRCMFWVSVDGDTVKSMRAHRDLLMGQHIHVSVATRMSGGCTRRLVEADGCPGSLGARRMMMTSEGIHAAHDT